MQRFTPAVLPGASLPRFIQSSKPRQMQCRPTRDGPLAQKWMKKIAILSDCSTGSAKCCVGTMAISQEHPEGFDLRGKSNPIAPFEMASGLLQVSSPSVKKCRPWSQRTFLWDGAGYESIYL